MSYIDGLPPAATVSSTDLIVVDQGGTGVPGSATTKRATVAQIVAQITFNSLPTDPTGLPTGTLWRNGNFICIV